MVDFPGCWSTKMNLRCSSMAPNFNNFYPKKRMLDLRPGIGSAFKQNKYLGQPEYLFRRRNLHDQLDQSVTTKEAILKFPIIYDKIKK